MHDEPADPGNRPARNLYAFYTPSRQVFTQFLDPPRYAECHRNLPLRTTMDILFIAAIAALALSVGALALGCERLGAVA
jgi:hypothetical protein